MRFSVFASLDASRSWRPSVASLIRSLEASGCELESPSSAKADRMEYEVLIPGLELRILRALGELSARAPFEHEWLQNARSGLWDRAVLSFDADSMSLDCRWIYWTPAQVLLHVSITFLFAMEAWIHFGADDPAFRFGVLLAGVALANGVPAIFAWVEFRKLRAIVASSGFRPIERSGL